MKVTVQVPTTNFIVTGKFKGKHVVVVGTMFAGTNKIQIKEEDIQYFDYPGDAQDRAGLIQLSSITAGNRWEIVPLRFE